MKKYGTSKVAKFAKILQGWHLTFNALAKQFLLPFGDFIINFRTKRFIRLPDPFKLINYLSTSWATPFP
jgi:hypothetical protein